MRKLVLAAGAIVILMLGTAASAQVETSVPTTEQPQQQTPAVTPDAQPDSPVEDPDTDPAGPITDVDDDDDGLSSTAILLIVLGIILFVLVIFAIVYSQRRPGHRHLD